MNFLLVNFQYHTSFFLMSHLAFQNRVKDIPFRVTKKKPKWRRPSIKSLEIFTDHHIYQHCHNNLCRVSWLVWNIYNSYSIPYKHNWHHAYYQITFRKILEFSPTNVQQCQKRLVSIVSSAFSVYPRLLCHHTMTVVQFQIDNVIVYYRYYWTRCPRNVTRQLKNRDRGPIVFITITTLCIRTRSQG